MATPERTQEEISKNIKRMADFLAAQHINPAEAKLQRKEKQELMKQEKLLQQQMDDHLLEKKEQLGEEKQTFKSMRGLISHDVKNYFDHTEANMVTWGGLAGSIKSGVKTWFEAAQKQRTALGATLRLGASLWQAAHKHIIDNVKKLWGAVTGQISEVLGELGGVLGFIKDSFMSVFRFVKDSFMGFFKRVPPHDRKRNKLLQAMVGFMRRREKRDMLQPVEKKSGGWMTVLGIIAAIAAAALGAIIGKILLPFRLIAKAIPIGKWLKPIISFFGKKIPFLGKLFAKISKRFLKAKDFIIALSKKANLLGKVLRAFKFGFTKILWPLQIALSVIDFIKGFQATEGNLAEKVIGGLKNAFMKFIELPVKLIGWIVEKVLGLFGVETEGVADKIMGWIGKAIDLFTAFWRPLIGFFEGFFKTKGSFMDKLKGGLGGLFDGIMKMLEVFKPFTEKIGKIIGGIKSFFGGDKEEEEPSKYPAYIKTDAQKQGYDNLQARRNTTTTPTSPLNNMTDAEAKKESEKQTAQSKAVTEAVEKAADKQIEANKKIADQQSDATALAMGGNSVSPPAETAPNPLQDEIDIVLGGNTNF